MIVNLLHVIADNFDKVYEKYKKLVFSVCFNILNNKADASDAMQETFMKLYKNMSLLKHKDMEQAWVVEAARCAAYDWIKKENQEPEKVNIDKLQPFICDINETPEEIFIGIESINKICDTMKQLDEKYATILIYRYYFELSPTEIAKLFNMSINTVYTRLRRGTDLLRVALRREREEAERK